MNNLSKLLLTIAVTFLLSSCTDNKYAINVPSKYKGWIYLIASKDSQNGFNFYPDSNGVIYIPEYCKSEKLLTLKIDGKEIPPTRVHFDNIFLSTDSFKVTYKQFYFPLTSSDLSNTLDTDIIYKGRALNHFGYLMATNKIDKLKITSCE